MERNKRPICFVFISLYLFELLKKLFKKWKFHFCLKIQKGKNVTLPILEAWNYFSSLWFSVQIVLVPEYLSPWADVPPCPVLSPGSCPTIQSLLSVSLIIPPTHGLSLTLLPWARQIIVKNRKRAVMWFYDGIYWVNWLKHGKDTKFNFRKHLCMCIIQSLWDSVISTSIYTI